MDCNTQHEHEELCRHAVRHLHEAGFSPIAGGPAGGLYMRRIAVDSTLTLAYEPSAGLLRLSVTFVRGAATRGIFRGGRAELRIFATSSLLGLLCWITSSHDDLSAFEADAWLEQILSLCPATYVVLESRSGEEVLALVMPQEASAMLQ
ncbi:hypothetical protein [Polyangium sp. 15x6]|uniref:hypothetical protein n=1 Tax=Polyangium sp. 15x6 TaxID=3042687 RepID=UPI00249C31E4|nr:hypothetical protein [Polyangium sp. 15x6]MDI3289444.1 hypothetical protein [Polyangium sp. 15x6]